MRSIEGIVRNINQIILRVGELHAEMAMHRTIGAYIEGSGNDSCWEESGLFGVEQLIPY